MEKKDVFVSAIKGFIVGIICRIPSMTIAAALLSVSSYENVVRGLSKPRDKNNKYLYYVTIPIVIGIILGLIAGIKLVNLSLDKYKIQTILLLTGLLIGSIRTILITKDIKLSKKSMIIPIITTILAIVFILLFKNKTLVISNNILHTIVFSITIGLSIFIPTISTYSMRLTNNSSIIINAIKNISNINSILIIVIFITIVTILVLILSKVIKSCFDKNKNLTYIILCSLLLSNVILVLTQIDKFKLNFVTIFTSLLAFLWGFIFSKNVERE